MTGWTAMEFGETLRVLRQCIGLSQKSCIEPFMGFLCLTSPHPLQLFGRMLQLCFAVKLQKWFVDYKTSPNFLSISSDFAVLLSACGSFLHEKSKELFLLANGIYKLTNWHSLISWLLFSDTSYANTKLRRRSVQSEFPQTDTWSRAGPANIKSCNVNVTQNVTHMQQNTFQQTHTHTHTHRDICQ